MKVSPTTCAIAHAITLLERSRAPEAVTVLRNLLPDERLPSLYGAQQIHEVDESASGNYLNAYFYSPCKKMVVFASAPLPEGMTLAELLQAVSAGRAWFRNWRIVVL